MRRASKDGPLSDLAVALSDRRKYRKFTTKQKVELVLASFRGDRSIAEIYREHDVGVDPPDALTVL